MPKEHTDDCNICTKKTPDGTKLHITQELELPLLCNNENICRLFKPTEKKI